MKYLYFGFLIFALNTTAFAQESINTKATISPVADRKIVMICRVSIPISKSPLYVVNGVVVDSAAVTDYIRPSSIQSMNVLKGASAIAVYGSRGQNGVILIDLKKDLKLWSLKDLFKNFRIKKKNWNWPVFVDAKELLSRPDFFIVNDIVAGVKVVSVEDKLPGKNKAIKISLKPL
jgi:TonB-dependent SusC/RagA subfamily outer membrane receptor